MASAKKQAATGSNRILMLAEDLVVVEARVRTISGVTSEGGEGSEDAFTSRGVRYVRKAELAPAFQYRQETIRVCRGIGTRFLSAAWAVPESRAESLLQALGGIGVKVNQFRDELADNWPRLLAEWEAQRPEIEPYKAKFPSANDVRARIGLSVATFSITPKPIVVPGIEDGVANELQDLPHRILAEVAQDVRDFWSATATSATQKIREPLGRIATKCSTLAFLGGHIGYVAGIVEDAIRALPSSGKIIDTDFTMLAGLLTMLSDPQAVERTAAMYPNLGVEDIFGVKNPTGNLFDNLDPDDESQAIPHIPPVPAALLQTPVTAESAWAW